MRKALIVSHVSGFVPRFESNNVRILQEMGYEVHYATNLNNPHYYKDNSQLGKLGVACFQVDFQRNPFSSRNIRAFYQLRKIVENGDYDLVHCHTPVASILARFVCRKIRKRGTKVLYTAHGFHFFKGASLLNWLIYYPFEKLSARWTDVLITINKEDFELATKKMHAGRVEYVPGVGIDFERFAGVVVDKKAIRMKLGVPQDALLLCSVGELNKNKNQEVVVRALAKLKDSGVYYVIVGGGKRQEYLSKLAKELGIVKQVVLLGSRLDVAELYKASDVCIFPSIREGLPLAPLEGMACGLPLICSDNRGTREYAVNGKNAIVCNWNDVDAFRSAIESLKNGTKLANFDKSMNFEELKNRFDCTIVNQMMKEVYRSL